MTLMGYASEIKRAMRRTVEDVFEIGALLVEAKEIFASNDEFLEWCEVEFQLKKTAVYSFIAVHEKFSEIRKRGDELPSPPLPSVLIELASFPDEEARALLAGEKTIPTAEGEKKIHEASVAEVKQYKKMLEERERAIKSLERELEHERKAAEQLKRKMKQASSSDEITKLKAELEEKDKRLLELSQELKATREYYENRLATGTVHEQKLFEIEVALKAAISKLERLARQAEDENLQRAIVNVCVHARQNLESIQLTVSTPVIELQPQKG
jgi:DNA repair exonuclease SbcCD ATPase subunit